MSLDPKNNADFDSIEFFKLMIKCGFVHNKFRLSWVFEFGKMEVHVMERDVLYIYNDQVWGYTRIKLQSCDTIEKIVTYICEVLVGEILSA